MGKLCDCGLAAIAVAQKNPEAFQKESSGFVVMRHAAAVAALCWLSIGSLAVAAKHVDDFVLVHLLHEVASGTAIFAGVEFARLVVEHLAHCCGEGQT